jgi:4-amino-4-deoxy-L-arabinose transferase-like glycosyltransferase
MPAPPRFFEPAAVAFAILVGAVARLWNIHQIGLSHFDAGVYAQSSLWPWTGKFHFDQGYFSPPLFPILWGLGNLLAGGPSDWIGSLLSALSSTALIPLAWWLSRSWFHAWAGIFAAWMLAVDGLAISFSRVALTDSLFALLFLAGFATCRFTLDRPTWSRITLAAVCVGLAWNTKYNGFMPIVLSAGFIPGPAFVSRLRTWLAISALSAALYLPWAISFHVEHGYESLIDHQRGYFLGPANYQQTLSEISSEYLLVYPPVVIAAFAFGGILLGQAGHFPLGFLVTIIPLALQPYLFVEYVGMPVFALCVIIFQIKGWHRWGWLWVLAWVLFLPGLYSPYLRLWIPTQLIMVMLVTKGVSTITVPEKVATPARRRQILGGGIAAALFVLALTGWVQRDRLATWQREVWEARAGYRTIAAEISGLSAEESLIFTLTRWPLNYYLALDGRAVRPMAEPTPLEAKSGDLFVTDHTLADTPAFRPLVDSLTQEWERVDVSRPDLDIVTRLDDAHGPVRNWADLQADRRDEIQVFRKR